jgi:hypothetical protein
MITITADFSITDIERDMNEDIERWFDEMAQALFEGGKAITDRAIAKVKTGAKGGGFGNITYNLRSSIGCGLFRNNVIEQDYFPFGKGAAGQIKGREVMNTVASEMVTDEIGLIFVAGEEYGVFVQMKGYDVTDMSWERFKSEFFNKLK